MTSWKSAAIALAVFAGCFFVSQRASSQRAGGESFTLLMAEKSTNPISGGQYERATYFARRGDGATASGPQAGSDNVQNRELILPHRRRNVLISDITKTTVTLHWPPQAPSSVPVRNYGVRCENAVPPEAVYVGEDILLGLRTYKFKYEDVLPSDHTDVVTWRASEVNCRELKQIAIRRNSKGAIIGQFERAATYVRLGEPDPHLFQEPASYEEVKPSEQDARIRKMKGYGPPDPACKQTYEQFDQRYEKSKLHAPR